MAMQAWVRLPCGWVEKKGLAKMAWGRDGVGSDNAAALMVLLAIAHHVDGETGIATLTYDALEEATGLSRSKVSNGLDVLEMAGIVIRSPKGRSTYALTDYDQAPWGKLPAKRMYKGRAIAAFEDFKLRSQSELNALKLYVLITARRDYESNTAHIGYEKIIEYTGMRRERIKAAISVLLANDLIHVEHFRTNKNPSGVSVGYRLVGVDPFRHMGTSGKSLDLEDSLL